jgi:hypothetical protein
MREEWRLARALQQHTGVESMPYDDVVREALATGGSTAWSHARTTTGLRSKVAPRKPTSKRSAGP